MRPQFTKWSITNLLVKPSLPKNCVYMERSLHENSSDFKSVINNNIHQKKYKRKSYEMPITSVPRKKLLTFSGKKDQKSTSKVKSDGKIIDEKYGVTYIPVPKQSRSDNKEYLVIKLRNGLTALIISDVENLIDLETMTPSESDFSSDASDDSNVQDHIYSSNAYETSKGEEGEESEEKLAACALTVGVGSFSDPEEIPGLAHFLEHMLFMGSEKYPKENDFDSYVAVRGGSDNASTECEHTTFYFDCPEVHLRSVMDRFAHFFTTPLMKKESMMREREAVESEFSLNLSSDSVRLEQLFCSTAPLNNPAHKFLWGNLLTLQQNVTDDFLYTQLREFWKTHYSANRMTLAVQGRLPLNILGTWVAECFSDIPCNNKPPIKFDYVDPPFTPELFHKKYTVLPINDTNKVEIKWAFPPVRHLYKTKPMHYLSYLIGHEGEGSLISYLRKKVWALDIIAGNSDNGIESNSMYSLFSIEINLTEEGVTNLDKVLELLFSYINLLKCIGPVESIYREIQVIEDTNFQFIEEVSPSDYTEDLSQNMQIYHPNDYITGDMLLFEYVPEVINNILMSMVPETVNIMLMSKSAAEKSNLDEVEKWFHTKYCKNEIPKEWINAWKCCKPIPEFVLPKPNVYIAQDFRILPISKNLPEYPEKIIDNDYVVLWYKQDNKFKLPYGYCCIEMISPIKNQTPQNAGMTELLISLFELLIIEETYPATVTGGLSFNILTTEHGISITVHGFNDKLRLLLQTLLKNLKTLSDAITLDVFDAVKEKQRKLYYNVMLKPSKLARDLRLSILCQPYWTTLSKLEALENIHITKIKEYINDFFEHLKVKCLVQGNMSMENAVSISNDVINMVQYKPLLEGTYPYTRIRKLPAGEYYLKTKSFNKNDQNCNVINYYQCGMHNIEESCKVELLMLIMEEPLFDTLRTQEQLGYDVGCDIRNSSGILGFSLQVKSQADKYNVEHVENRMNEFLKKMEDKLKTISVEDFNQVKESLKIMKQQVDTRLKEEVKRNWEEIISDEYVFSRLKKEVACIEQLKRDDIYSYFVKTLQNYGEDEKKLCLRKLSVQVDGKLLETNVDGNIIIDSDSAMEYNELKMTSNDHPYKMQLTFLLDRNSPDKKYISDIEQFKNDLYAYPICKVV